jgi:cytochrome c553
MNETPALTGMSPRMFIRQMNAYKDGTRHNDVNSGMAQFTKDLTDEEIQALADYYAQLKPRGAQ